MQLIRECHLGGHLFVMSTKNSNNPNPVVPLNLTALQCQSPPPPLQSNVHS